MKYIGTFKFENPGEAAIFAEALKTYPAAETTEKLEQIGDVVLVRAVGKRAVKGILTAAWRAIVTEGRYPWNTKTEEKTEEK